MLSDVWRTYLQSRAISRAVADERPYTEIVKGHGVRYDTDASLALPAGFPKGFYGMLIHLCPLLGGDAWLLRVDDDLLAAQKQAGKRAPKFRTPDGQPNVLATHPRTAPHLRELAQELWVVEGVTRVDALASLITPIPAVGLNGCWGWRTRRKKGEAPTALGDWQEAGVPGRSIVVCLDGDVVSDTHVNKAGRELRNYLLAKGAHQVAFIVLPDDLGLDDYIAARNITTREELATALETDQCLKKELSRVHPRRLAERQDKQLAKAPAESLEKALEGEMPSLRDGMFSAEPVHLAKVCMRYFGKDLIFIDGEERTPLIYDDRGLLYPHMTRVVPRVADTLREALTILAPDAIKAGHQSNLHHSVRRMHKESGQDAAGERVANNLYLAAHQLGMLTERTTTYMKILEHTPYLGVENGVVDLRSGNLVDRDTAREAMVLGPGLPTTYERHAPRCPLVDKWLGSYAREQGDYLLDYIARSLWANPAELVLLVQGEPDAGKSSLLELLRTTLGHGEFAIGNPIMLQRRDNSSHNDEDYPLVYSRLVAFEDNVADMEIPVSRLTRLTSGGGAFTLSRKGEQGRSMILRAMLILTGNRVPALAYHTDELRKRVRLVELPQHVENDPRIKLSFSHIDGPSQRYLLRLLIERAAVRCPENDKPEWAPSSVTLASNALADAATGQEGLWVYNNLRVKFGGKLRFVDILDAYRAEKDPDAKESVLQKAIRKELNVVASGQWFPQPDGTRIKFSCYPLGWRGLNATTGAPRTDSHSSMLDEDGPCCPHPPEEHDHEGACIHSTCDCLGEDVPTGAPTGDQPHTVGGTSPGVHPVAALMLDDLTNGDDTPEAEWETQQLQALYDSRAMERFAQRHLDALGGAYWVYSAAYRVLLEHEGTPGTPDWHTLVSATLADLDTVLQKGKEATIPPARASVLSRFQREHQGRLGLTDGSAA